MWKTSIGHKTRGSGCPFCSNRKVELGFNDLATTHPELALEWHPTKNGKVTPETVTAGISEKVWWLGTCGHEWKTAPIKRSHAGSGCLVCAGKVVLVGFNDLASKAPHLLKEWHPTKNGKSLPYDFTFGSSKRAWWICSKGHEWDTVIGERTRITPSGCPKCVTSVSKVEQLISDYVINLNFAVVPSDRTILKGMELDIYIPEKNIAIEYNGIYWHSEKGGKNKNYHHNKWLECKNQDIQLIQIWEDDWNRNPEQVKRMLTHKLGVSTEPKVFARKTVVQTISKIQAENFLNINHIQGHSNGSYYLGLLEQGDIEKLVAVLVLKKEAGTEGKTLNIIRYATSANVVGGFTKLLKHAERAYQPESFITFADHTVSDGGLYINNGFVADKELPPDYMYVVGAERKHKFGYRLKRFKNDPDLKYIEGMSEKQLAELNNLPRIWDAGKTRYVKRVCK